MNIRWKVGALIAALLAMLGVSELFVASHVLMPSFAELERSEAAVAMRRVRYGMDRSLEQLAVSATSWGNWADTYRFARDHNQPFVRDNLTAIGLEQLTINALVVMDVTGRVIASGALDLEPGESADLEALGKLTARADFPWRIHLTDGRAARGILQTQRGPMLVAAAPILNGVEKGPSRGMIVMGRFLSAGVIARLGSQAQVALSLLPPAIPGAPGIIETEANTAVYEPMSDIYGNPVLTLRVDVPREVTRRGSTAVRYATGVLMGTAAVIVVLLVLTLNKVVLNPLARVTRHAKKLGAGVDLTGKLNFERTDEIGVLAHELDQMVARIAATRGQLVDQSFEAGFAELAKGVLHNLGNAMTPIGVRLSQLQSRLSSLDSEDLRWVALELDRGELEAERCAALAELLRLTHSSWSATLADARSDAEVISRQTAVVQSALAEQMQATCNEHVWEVVGLTDLVSQALEVVPDASHRRLSIEFDASVAGVGPQSVPRTVLRLVLQNIIINAADSIGETGRSRGSLKIAAQIRRDLECEQLVLHCTDDGIGIAGDHLARIFQKNFSTKSRQTHFGIGLHWCANSLAALGGQIWASSEGLGRGASFHVLLPLRTFAEQAIEAA